METIYKKPLDKNLILHYGDISSNDDISILVRSKSDDFFCVALVNKFNPIIKFKNNILITKVVTFEKSTISVNYTFNHPQFGQSLPISYELYHTLLNEVRTFSQDIKYTCE